MKHHAFIIGIIFCSIISGALGSFLFQEYFIQKNDNFPISQEIETPRKKENISQPRENIQNLENTIVNLVAEVSPSVVSIIIKKDLIIYKSDPFGFFRQPAGTIEQKVWGGTGFFVKEDGTIITNKHVISDSDAVYTIITSSGEEYDAEVIALDPLNDIAVLKINWDHQFQTIQPINSTENIQLGQFAIAIGNALAEFQNSVSLGIISGKERSIEWRWEKLTGLIQTDTAINPGNSGWPLINLEWNVIWINTAIINNSEWIGFAIALTKPRLEYILTSIEKYGTIKRPFIGINYIPNSPGIQQELWLAVDYGVYIIDEPGSVVSGSSAEESGLEPGDVITSINKQKITSDISLLDIIQNKIPGDTLELEVIKKSWEIKDIELILWEI